jgi:SAM-dependent methyltransferase
VTVFFELHKALHREGPGEPADIAWAITQMNVPPKARICDAACGPGADIETWLSVLPEAQARIGPHPQVTILEGDMAKLTGPFDVIWCAGAAYFLGIEDALRLWKPALASGGYVVFSDACWFTQNPSPILKDFWSDYPAMTHAAGIAAHVAAAGYETLATRRLSHAAWEAYYTPMEARITTLRSGAYADLSFVLDEGQEEIDMFRRYGDEYGYLLSVVRPL